MSIDWQIVYAQGLGWRVYLLHLEEPFIEHRSSGRAVTALKAMMDGILALV